MDLLSLPFPVQLRHAKLGHRTNSRHVGPGLRLQHCNQTVEDRRYRVGFAAPRRSFVVSIHRFQPVPGSPTPSVCGRSSRPHAGPHCLIAIDALASALSTAERTSHSSSSVLLSSIATRVLTGMAHRKCCRCVRLPDPMLRRPQSHAQRSPRILAVPATRRDPRKKVWRISHLQRVTAAGRIYGGDRPGRTPSAAVRCSRTLRDRPVWPLRPQSCRNPRRAT